jgi:hypothetical protein
MANRAERRRILRNSTTGGLTMVTGGPQVEAQHKYNADLPPVVPGEHLWIMITTYRVRNPENFSTERFHADLENLISIDGPGCLWCEKTYSEAKGQRCAGEAS